MYSTTIKPKVEKLISELREKVITIIANSSNSDEAVSAVIQLVSSKLASRSKSILSDMLFELSDSLMETDYFSDVSKRNKFFEINLRQEILNKYQFTPSTTVDYKEASRTLEALKIGGITFAAGGAIEVLTVFLIPSLSFSSLVPIPLGLLFAASVGMALADYYAIEPVRNKKKLGQAIDNYLVQAQNQFLQWFDEVEVYFNKRVEEIKKEL